MAREDAAERDEAIERDRERGILERPPGSVSRPFDDLRHEKRLADAADAEDEWRRSLREQHEETIAECGGLSQNEREEEF